MIAFTLDPNIISALILHNNILSLLSQFWRENSKRKTFENGKFGHSFFQAGEAITAYPAPAIDEFRSMRRIRKVQSRTQVGSLAGSTFNRESDVTVLRAPRIDCDERRTAFGEYSLEAVAAFAVVLALLIIVDDGNPTSAERISISQRLRSAARGGGAASADDGEARRAPTRETFLANLRALEFDTRANYANYSLSKATTGSNCCCCRCCTKKSALAGMKIKK